MYLFGIFEKKVNTQKNAVLFLILKHMHDWWIFCVHNTPNVRKVTQAYPLGKYVLSNSQKKIDISLQMITENGSVRWKIKGKMEHGKLGSKVTWFLLQSLLENKPRLLSFMNITASKCNNKCCFFPSLNNHNPLRPANIFCSIRHNKDILSHNG